MLIVFLRSIILYIVAVFAIRFMGKRQIGELQPTELVITIFVSNIATLPLEDLNIPLLGGIIAVLSLVCFDIVLSGATLKYKRLRRIVSGTPKIVIQDGIIDQLVLRELRFSVDDLMVALRGNHIFDIGNVQFAIVETNGKISVYEKFEEQNITKRDLRIKGFSKNPPAIIIENGKIDNNVLTEIQQDKEWVYKILSEKRLALKDVFLLIADIHGNYQLIKKDERGKTYEAS